MNLFGTLRKLTSIQFLKDTFDVTLRPSSTTTYTAARTIDLPPGDAAHVLVSEAATQTLTGKTIDGDSNTVQDLPLTAIKTVLADAGKVLLRDSVGTPSSAAVTGDITLSSTGVAAIASGVVVDADISASAAVAYSKLATLASGNLLVGSAGGVATSVAVTGDVTISSTGVTAIGTGVVVNADVSASAAIAGTKISPAFGSQAVSTTGTLAAGITTITGNITVSGTATTGGLIGRTSGVTVATGTVGEVLTFNKTGSTPTVTADTVVEVQSFTLTAGVWCVDVDYSVSIEATIDAPTGQGQAVEVRLTADDGVSLYSRAMVSRQHGTTGTANNSIHHLHITSTVNVSSSTTLKIMMVCNQSASQAYGVVYPDGNGYSGATRLAARVQAVRIA